MNVVPFPGWMRTLQTSDKGAIRCNTTNAIIVLQNHQDVKGLLAWDQFSERIAFTRSPPWASDVDGQRHGHWEEGDMVRLVDWFARTVKIQMKPGTLEPVIPVVSEQYTHHPARDYFSGLTWDGNPRLATWLLTYCSAEGGEYSGKAGTFWMISAVARAMRPGCQVDSMLILEGAQGTRKTSTFRALCPDSAWYSDTGISVGDKDSYQALHGLLIYVFDELDALARADATRTKAFVSATRDRFRPPYARLLKSFARQNVFAGTTNHSEYLQDKTGNRRYWPVKVREACDVKAIERDRDQLWAEAVHRYQAGELWYPSTPEESALFGLEQSTRVQPDDWEPRVANWLANPMVTTWEPETSGGARKSTSVPYDASQGVSTLDVLVNAIGKPVKDILPRDSKRAGEVLRAIGYTRVTRVHEHGARVRRYIRP